MAKVRHDILGNEVKPGVLLAYAVAAGRAQVLNLYRVLEVTDSTIICKQVIKKQWGSLSTRESRLQDPENRGIVIFFHEFKA